MLDSRQRPIRSTDVDLEASPNQEPIVRLDKTPNPKLSFPPLPKTVTSVTRLMEEMGGEPNTLQLAEIVDGDPVIAAAVLRRINSAYYGMRRRVGSVRKAVMLLGFLEVANIVMTAGMVELEESFAADEQSEVFDEILRANISVAQFGRELTERYNHLEPARTYTAGLLHGVGRLVLLYNEPDLYATLWNGGDTLVIPTVEEERAAFGTDHAQIGARAADEWKLPTPLIETIRGYPNPSAIEDEGARRLAIGIAAASSVVAQLRQGTAPDALEARPAIQQFADLLGESTDAVLRLVRDKHDRVQQYIDTMISS